MVLIKDTKIINNRKYILPNWPAPKNIKAFITTRQGGASNDSYKSFNLGDNTQDHPDNILLNKKYLTQDLSLPGEPAWLNQVHGDHCIELNNNISQAKIICADAAFTTRPETICLVRTADCLPILLCNTSGTKVAAVHAGWKGFISGVIECTIAKLSFDNYSQEGMAWLGPAISQKNFELGPEVYELFLEKYNFAENYFIYKNNKYFLDLIGLAKAILEKHNITAYHQDYCTYAQEDLFFSYRRNNETGRMASLIWLEN